MPSCGQFRQFARRRLPAALRREGADMHLVDDHLLARPAAPVPVGPAERAGIDDLRRPVRSLRLKARGRVGQAACRACRCGSRSACPGAPRRPGPSNSRPPRPGAGSGARRRSRPRSRERAAPRPGNARRPPAAAPRRPAGGGQTRGAVRRAALWSSLVVSDREIGAHRCRSGSVAEPALRGERPSPRTLPEETWVKHPVGGFRFKR